MLLSFSLVLVKLKLITFGAVFVEIVASSFSFFPVTLGLIIVLPSYLSMPIGMFSFLTGTLEVNNDGLSGVVCIFVVYNAGLSGVVSLSTRRLN